MDDWNTRREAVLRFAQRKLAQGILNQHAVQAIDIQLSRGVNDRDKRLKCIRHIEIELAGIDGCSDLDLHNWKRLYYKGKARRRQKGQQLQLPNTTKSNHAGKIEHRKKQHKDASSKHTKRLGSSTRRRDDLHQSHKKHKHHVWNEVEVADMIAKKVPRRTIAKNRGTKKSRQLKILLRDDKAVYIPSPPSRVVNKKRFFGKQFEQAAPIPKPAIAAFPGQRRRPGSGGHTSTRHDAGLGATKKKKFVRSSSTRAPSGTIRRSVSTTSKDNNSNDSTRQCSDDIGLGATQKTIPKPKKSRSHDSSSPGSTIKRSASSNSNDSNSKDSNSNKSTRQRSDEKGLGANKKRRSLDAPPFSSPIQVATSTSKRSERSASPIQLSTSKADSDSNDGNSINSSPIQLASKTCADSDSNSINSSPIQLAAPKAQPLPRRARSDGDAASEARSDGDEKGSGGTKNRSDSEGSGATKNRTALRHTRRCVTVEQLPAKNFPDPSRIRRAYSDSEAQVVPSPVPLKIRVSSEIVTGEADTPINRRSSVESIPYSPEQNAMAVSSEADTPINRLSSIESIPYSPDKSATGPDKSATGGDKSATGGDKRNANECDSDFSFSSFASDEEEEDEDAKRKRQEVEESDPLVLDKHVRVFSECYPQYSWSLVYEVGSGWRVEAQQSGGITEELSTGPLGASDLVDSTEYTPTFDPTTPASTVTTPTTASTGTTASTATTATTASTAVVSPTNAAAAANADTQTTTQSSSASESTSPLRSRRRRSSVLGVPAAFGCIGMHLQRLVCGFLSVGDMRACCVSSSFFCVPVLGGAAVRLMQYTLEVEYVQEFVEIAAASGPSTDEELVPWLARVVNWFEDCGSSGASPAGEAQFMDTVLRLLRVADDICAAPDPKGQADRFQANLVRAYVESNELDDLARMIAPIVFAKTSYPLYGVGLSNAHQTKSFRPDEHMLVSVEQPLIPIHSQRLTQFGAPDAQEDEADFKEEEKTREGKSPREGKDEYGSMYFDEKDSDSSDAGMGK